MRKRGFGRRRRTNAWILALMLFLTALLLVSCVAGSNVLWVRGVLGLDIDDYFAEPAEQTLPSDGRIAADLCAVVGVVLDDRVTLQPFGGTAEAVETYRDEILNYMLRTQYERYVGDRKSITKTQAVYPHTVFSTLVPASDFENTVFRYFGGTTVEHKSGDLFSYLDRADFYTSPISARAGCAEVQVERLEETQSTYRMTFRLSCNGEISQDLYRAVFVKRTDGTAYWKALEIL